MMSEFNVSGRIEKLSSEDFGIAVDILRLDLLHPVVSGNKWFKLQVYLSEAKQQQKKILTFGGAFSNHIVATAAAARNIGLACIGIIRGEEAPLLSHTLLHAKGLGMELYFTDRKSYEQKIIPRAVYEAHPIESLYIIPEGGYGIKGMEGARDILLKNNTSSYTHVISAVGTGTTLAGLISAAGEQQKVIGISVMKNNYSLEKEIRQLLPTAQHHRFELLHDFHFGGYAKSKKELIGFMNDFYNQTGIPTDFVYTAKAFYAAIKLIEQGYLTKNDRILLIHTGGLQGNSSLPKGTLIFE